MHLRLTICRLESIVRGSDCLLKQQEDDTIHLSRLVMLQRASRRVAEMGTLGN
jgi:hypothetical protein